jgi:hypothetical protein
MSKPVVFLAAVAALLALAVPAWAHEEINPKQFPTGQPTFFSLNAANEKQADLTKITFTSPPNVKFGATTHEPPGWTVNRTDSVITWTGGTVKPDHFDQWGYEIDSADQPGTLSYKVALSYSDGKTDNVNVQTTAVAPGTPQTTVATPAPGAVTTEATTTPATEATKSSNASGARSRANIALGLGAVALVASLVALSLAARKRGDGAGAATAGGEGQKQDW